MARRAAIGAMKNRPAARMRRTNWSVEAGFSGERYALNTSRIAKTVTHPQVCA